MAIRKLLRNITPSPLRQAFWSQYFRAVRSANRLWQLRELFKADYKWFFDHRRLSGSKRMKLLQNKHEGKRCFIIGNGPSLRRTDLSFIRDEYTFGLNRIYLLFDKIDFVTSYYVAVNSLVIEQFANDIINLPMPKFLSWQARQYVPWTSNLIFLRDRNDGTFGFSENPYRRIWEGSTVTYVAMQLAYWMGFNQVILIGVDHSFSSQGPAHTIVLSQEEDRNHFDANYFGRGIRWQLPDLRKSELAYRIAKHTFECNNRKILDATIDGKLDIFEKVDYLSLF